MIGKCTNRRLGKLIALYEFGALDESQRSAFLDHLIECEHCYSEVYSLEPVMSEFRSHRDAAKKDGTATHDLKRVVSARRQPRFWRPIPVLAALFLLAVSAGVVYLVSRPDTGPVAKDGDTPPAMTTEQHSTWANLSIPKAAYAPPKEGVTLRKPTKAFERAMAAYEQNDFASAIEQLETLRELEPSDGTPVSLYLGISLLLTGRSRDAIRHLKQGIESGTGSQRETSHYYLALAYLKSDQAQEAILELDKTIEMNGEYEPIARTLREQVINTIKQPLAPTSPN